MYVVHVTMVTSVCHEAIDVTKEGLVSRSGRDLKTLLRFTNYSTGGVKVIL